MYILLVLILIIASFTVVFAIQNTEMVSVSFLSLQFESSIALILLIAFMLGVIVAMLFSLPYFYRYNKTIKELSQKLKESPGSNGSPDLKTSPDNENLAE